MTIEDAERIVKKVHPNAFAFISELGHWSICDGTRCAHGNIRIPGVGWYERAEQAWHAAAAICREE